MGLSLTMCFLSIAAGTMTGFYLYKRETGRQKYLESLISLCNQLISDIKFSQRTTAVLIKNFMLDRATPLENNLTEYLAYIEGGTDELTLSKGTLKTSEYQDLKSFFASLGTFDSETQVFDIEGYKQKFCLYKEEQSKKVDKYAKNYIKLGFLFGLALGILMM